MRALGESCLRCGRSGGCVSAGVHAVRPGRAGLLAARVVAKATLFQETLLQGEVKADGFHRGGGGRATQEERHEKALRGAKAALY